MTVRDLIPWGRSRSPMLAGDADPFTAMRRELNRTFEEFSRAWSAGLPQVPAGAGVFGWPQMDVEEGEKEVRVTLELPGLDERDVEVSLNCSVLSVRGEKRVERNGGSSLFSERFHGRFQRSVDLRVEVEADRTSASFKDGVLTIVAPKSEEAASRVKRIPITTSAH